MTQANRPLGSRVSRRAVLRGMGIGTLGLAGAALVGCGDSDQKPPGSAAGSATAAAPAGASGSAAAGTPTAAPTPVKNLMKVEPVSGYINDRFTVVGEGLSAGSNVEFVWMTSDGAFKTDAKPETIEFYEPVYTPKQIVLGKATADGQGRATGSFTAPEDHGGAHDIYAVVDGKQVARGGFQIKRQITVSPSEGPIGMPITITATGLGTSAIERALAIRFGNQYVGYMTGVTTRGTAVARIRAAGPTGLYNIELSGMGNHGGGYLNNQQSPYKQFFPEIGSFRFPFKTTGDAGAPANTLEWPSKDRVVQLSADAPRTTYTGFKPAPGVTAALEPAIGPILTETTLRAKGLAPNAAVELLWVTARGNRVTPSGWEFNEEPLTTGKTDASGGLQMPVKIPEGLGGWHMLRVVLDRKVVAETPFNVQQSLAHVPRQVKLGAPFSVTLKGIGWTELDNTVAVTYDNAYIGYACGFNSDGDVTVNLQAVGTPGTHLIDIYPTTFQGKTGQLRWGYQMPHVSGLADHPSLNLGYTLPIYRLAIDVVA